MNNYILISTTRIDLDISESFYPTQKEAHDAMVADIILMTDYESVEEIIEDANAGRAGFSDDEAWAETKQCGTGQWKIVEVPEAKSIKVETPEGTIVVEAKGAKDEYPGIWIFRDNNQPMNMLAAVEYNTPDKRFQTESYCEVCEGPVEIIDCQTGESLM